MSYSSDSPKIEDVPNDGVLKVIAKPNFVSNLPEQEVFQNRLAQNKDSVVKKIREERQQVEDALDFMPYVIDDCDDIEPQLPKRLAKMRGEHIETGLVQYQAINSQQMLSPNHPTTDQNDDVEPSKPLPDSIVETEEQSSL
jgi:hypothetical protein